MEKCVDAFAQVRLCRQVGDLASSAWFDSQESLFPLVHTPLSSADADCN